MEFSIIAKTLENMEGTTKRLELTDFLVGLFKETSQDLLPKIVYLIQGKIRPDFEGIELGMAEKLAIRSLSKSSGCLLYTSPSPRDATLSRMPSSA